MRPAARWGRSQRISAPLAGHPAPYPVQPFRPAPYPVQPFRPDASVAQAVASPASFTVIICV